MCARATDLFGLPAAVLEGSGVLQVQGEVEVTGTEAERVHRGAERHDAAIWIKKGIKAGRGARHGLPSAVAGCSLKLKRKNPNSSILTWQEFDEDLLQELDEELPRFTLILAQL